MPERTFGEVISAQKANPIDQLMEVGGSAHEALENMVMAIVKGKGKGAKASGNFPKGGGKGEKGSKGGGQGKGKGTEKRSREGESDMLEVREGGT